MCYMPVLLSLEQAQAVGAKVHTSFHEVRAGLLTSVTMLV